MSQNKTLTTASGAPVADNQNSRSAGPRGPLLLDDFHLIEKLAHFNRENIPERRVHAKGSGAYGTFTVTKLHRTDLGKIDMFGFLIQAPSVTFTNNNAKGIPDVLFLEVRKTCALGEEVHERLT